MRTLFLCLFSLLSLSSNFCHAVDQPQKTVLIAILARNKAHVLPEFLNRIEKLDYDKKLITLYINTNNNVDDTAIILQDWAQKNEHKYSKIELEQHEVAEDLTIAPHDWNVKRTSVLSHIRNKSLKKTKEYGSDYYFVVDCDNFISSTTLKDMVLENKPIIAPMLSSLPLGYRYSNFFYETTPSGFFSDHPLFDAIGTRSIIGTFKVPLVHCTYLIDAQYIDKLSYSLDISEYEFIAFAQSANKNNIDQYICNKKEYGFVLHYDAFKMPLEEEAKEFSKLHDLLEKIQ